VDVLVPGRLARALSGVVVRDGRYYWSGFTMWWRMALLLFVIKFAFRLAVAPPRWRAEPELWGIPGFNMPIAGMSATTPIVAMFMVLFTWRARRRFNAAAPRVDGREG
jgi:heme/copper-type cytochrome/quinol oxidase subunit 2